MGFLNTFAACLLLLAALDVIAGSFGTINPVLEQFTWPGAVITAGIFLIARVNLFEHPAVFDVFAVVFNAAIVAAVVVVVRKLVRIAFGRS